jgi:hypothetical protein
MSELGQQRDFRSLDERRAKVAEKIASHIEIRLKGGPNLKEDDPALIDGLRDELSPEERVEWKRQAAEEWDRIEAPPIQPAQPEATPVKQSGPPKLIRRLLKPLPAAQPKPKPDEEPQTEAALKVLGKGEQKEKTQARAAPDEETALKVGLPALIATTKPLANENVEVG